MIDDTTWKYVATCLAALKKQDGIFQTAHNVIQTIPESPTKEPFYRVSDVALNALELMIVDCDDTLSWFAYECDYGRTPQEAGKEGNMRLISSTDDLRWFLELEDTDT